MRPVRRPARSVQHYRLLPLQLHRLCLPVLPDTGHNAHDVRDQVSPHANLGVNLLNSQ